MARPSLGVSQSAPRARPRRLLPPLRRASPRSRRDLCDVCADGLRGCHGEHRHRVEVEAHRRRVRWDVRRTFHRRPSRVVVEQHARRRTRHRPPRRRRHRQRAHTLLQCEPAHALRRVLHPRRPSRHPEPLHPLPLMVPALRRVVPARGKKTAPRLPRLSRRMGRRALRRVLLGVADSRARRAAPRRDGVAKRRRSSACGSRRHRVDRAAARDVCAPTREHGARRIRRTGFASLYCRRARRARPLFPLP